MNPFTFGSALGLAMGLSFLTATISLAYPLNADDSGIRRLQGQKTLLERKGGTPLPVGARLSSDSIRLHLLKQPDWNFAPAGRNAALQGALEKVFTQRDPSYGVMVVDITDPNDIQWAGVRERRRQAPGSVGKILCMTALFDGLRRAFPDIKQRQRVLRERWIEAGDWAIGDSHKVPRLNVQSGTLDYAVIAPGDRFTLSEWIDHMISASANSAASTVWKEAILLRAFGSDYPPSPEQESNYFRTTAGSVLRDLAQAVINDALAAAELNPDELRVGSFWTRAGKNKVPSVGGSRATPLELARWLLRVEQGRLVDEWTSLEMKRYLYMTKRRYRYAYAPELANAAVYFKSGSLFRCTAEAGFKCGKYMGNLENAMNSVAIIESPAENVPEQKRYLVALTSDVRKVNSAWDHSRLGAAIEEIVRLRQTVEVRDTSKAGELLEVGRSE